MLCQGGRKTNVMGDAKQLIRKGDVIGCLIDLTVPMISFTTNGALVKGSFHDFNLDSMFFPVISCSSKVRYVTCLYTILTLDPSIVHKGTINQEHTISI